jgi:hypothetical protein
MAAASRPLKHFAASKVGVREEVRREVFGFIANPPDLSVVFGGGDITYQPVQFAVALSRPFGDEAGEVADRSQQVKSRHARRVKDLHKYLGSQRLKNPAVFFRH